MSHPTTMTYASVPVKRGVTWGPAENLVRPSVGLEYLEDLMGKLEGSLNEV